MVLKLKAPVCGVWECVWELHLWSGWGWKGACASGLNYEAEEGNRAGGDHLWWCGCVCVSQTSSPTHTNDKSIESWW
jgi:hypothetical protein